jgi:hypothetical protein
MRLQLAVLTCLTLATSAFALGTASNIDIDNKASVNYSLGSTPQTVIESAPGGNSLPGVGVGSSTTFKVDNKIDFVVSEADGAYTIVAPNSTFQAVAFTLRNDGNTTQDFSFTSAEVATTNPDAHGGTDDFNGSVVGIYVESTATVGYQQFEDTALYADQILADGTTTIYVVRDIGGESDDTSSAVILTVQVAVGDTASSQGADILSDDSGDVDDPAVVQIVFADGGGDTDGLLDGRYSDTDAFLVQTAALQISKTSTVYRDPFNLLSNPKAIPGATIEYEVAIAHTGGTGTATSVTITDNLTAEITAATIAFDLNGYAAGEGLEVEAPNLYLGAATSLSNGADADEGVWDAGTNTLTVDGIQVAPGETAYVRYRVTIQ